MSGMVNAKCNDIFSQFVHLSLGNGIPDVKNIHRRNIVVKGSIGQIRPADLATIFLETLKGLGTGHLMDIMLVHIHELGLA